MEVSSASSPTAITIAPYADADREAILELILSIQRAEFGIAITREDQPDLLDVPGFYRLGAGDFWVARASERIVGTIALKDIGGHQAALRKMFVAPPWRGREHRVAARLLETLRDAARTRGIREIFLGTTAAFHAAHRFYEKNGFVEVAETTLPATFPRMAVDTKFYRQSFER